ncbi:hypothetical protein [Streptomyces sp. NPDC048111]|uniref:hypothetical protein n=1 Tax=Streptomyces sp. NPDC048111 TaxID=3365500 RepID=UPI00371A6FE5
MKREIARRISAIMIFGAAVMTAAPAVAKPASGLGYYAYSPGSKAVAMVTPSYAYVSLKQVRSGKSHADYYRAAGGNDLYHLWNKSGAGTTVWSDSGSTVGEARVCNWVPDNDDDCGDWEYD